MYGEPSKQLIRSMPVLQVTDVVASVAFYRDKLGFMAHKLWGEPPSFCIVQRGKVTIALDRTRAAGGSVPVNQYWAAYVYVENADKLCDEFRTKGVEIVRGPEDMEYGLRDFDVRDPDGHLIAFGHDLLPAKFGPGLVQAG
jgi:catechol 2,3-dioxygenase-like lactoylglutathione lyase family enzyme